jgi:hypothetical protein
LDKFLVGFATRRRYANAIFGFKQARQLAAIVLQIKLKALLKGFIARKHVAYLRRLELDAEFQHQQELLAIQRAIAQAKAEQLRKNQAATTIQRILSRGVQARKYVQTLRQRRLLQANIEFIRNKHVPIYWRLHDEYYKSQNFYHRPFIIKIQCCARRFLAKYLVKIMRYNTVRILHYRLYADAFVIYSVGRREVHNACRSLILNTSMLRRPGRSWNDAGH